MMWTAILGQIEQHEQSWSYTIVYVNEALGKKFASGYQSVLLSDDVIRQTARNEIARLDQVSSASGKISLVIGQPIDIALPASKEPTAEEFALAEHASNRFELRRLMDDVRDGLVVDEKRVAELRLLIQASGVI